MKKIILYSKKKQTILNFSFIFIFFFVNFSNLKINKILKKKIYVKK